MKEETQEASVHWSQQNERAAGYWQLKMILYLFKIFPIFLLRILAFPVGFFYFIFAKATRHASRRFLQRIAQFISDPKLAKECLCFFAPLKHIISFSLTLIEKVQSWGGRFSFKNIHFQDDDIKHLISELEEGKGAFLVFSHLGNCELLRGLLNFDKTGVSRKIPVTTIMDMKVSAHFTKMLKELNPQSSMDIIGADEIGPETAVLLENRLTSGGVVAIAGDRTSATGGKNLNIPFLGKEAPFPSGVFYMFSLLKYPVYFVFGLRRKCLALIPQYNMFVHKSSISFECSRKERIQKSSLLADFFVSLLENYCKKYPFQWYNFFDFWHGGEKE
jgi:predicted LPLAT superfamily acyltransferase